MLSCLGHCHIHFLGFSHSFSLIFFFCNSSISKSFVCLNTLLPFHQLKSLSFNTSTSITLYCDSSNVVLAATLVNPLSCHFKQLQPDDCSFSSLHSQPPSSRSLKCHYFVELSCALKCADLLKLVRPNAL